MNRTTVTLQNDGSHAVEVVPVSGQCGERGQICVSSVTLLSLFIVSELV